MAHREILSLYQLSQQIKEVLNERFAASLWIRAEIAEFRENRNGHCYLDLVEKSEGSDQIVARVRAIIWSYTYRMVKPYFESTTGRSLSSGLKVLVQVQVEFQEVYGLSLIIRDIDPTFTLGDLEQRRREVISRLQQEGVFDMNRELEFPLVAQRIAVISSPTAAGYGDFRNQLESNAYGVKFYYHLFPAIMQGDQAAASIADAFEKIYEHISFFDAVVIIRGGGATLDLICFDDYWVAYNITQFPLPVITGIGHERDRSVADMVAHSSHKTPTAVAEFLITQAAAFYEKINQYAQYTSDWVTRELDVQNQRLAGALSRFGPNVKLLLQSEKHKVQGYSKDAPALMRSLLQQHKSSLAVHVTGLKQVTRTLVISGQGRLAENFRQMGRLSHAAIKQHKKQLLYFEKNNHLNDPVHILKRGFTLTYLNGIVVKDGQALSPGDRIQTRFRDGEVASVVGKK